jgi:NOL1/NOP2/fmu family ribosome biogenesis protein
MSQYSPNDGWEYLKTRFGIDRERVPYRLEKVNGDLWLVSEQMDDFLQPETKGIRAVRCMDIGLKPTTYLLQLLEDAIELNKVELDEDEFKDLLDGSMIEREMDEKGYVALSFRGKIYGCGLYKDELVSSRIPKGRAQELLEIIK